MDGLLIANNTNDVSTPQDLISLTSILFHIPTQHFPIYLSGSLDTLSTSFETLSKFFGEITNLCYNQSYFQEKFES